MIWVDYSFMPTGVYTMTYRDGIVFEYDVPFDFDLDTTWCRYWCKWTWTGLNEINHY